MLENMRLEYEIKKIEYDTYKGSRNLREREQKVTEYLWIINKS